VNTPAHYRFMFVIDPDAYRALCSKTYSSKAIGVEIIDLITGETFICV
jgi:hypothetical protein